MHLHCTLHGPGERTRRVDVSAQAGATVADLVSSLVPLGLLPRGQWRAIVDGVALPDSARLGSPPLLQGAGIRLVDASSVAASGRVGGAPTAVSTLGSLHVLSGPGMGGVLDLRVGRHTLGRGAECRLRVEDDSLSRVHAVLEVSADAVTVADAGSTNGTWIDGRVQRGHGAELAAGQRLRIGRTELALRRVDGPLVAMRPDHAGHLMVSRPPHSAPWAPAAAVPFPDPPTSAEPRRLPLLAALLPLAVSGTLAAVTHSPTLLLLGLMSPILVLGQWVSDRRSGRRASRLERIRYAAKLAAAEAALRAALRAETAARRAQDPDPAMITEIARRRLAGLWDRTTLPGLSVRLGCGNAPAQTQSPGAEQPPTVADVPITVDLAKWTGLAGPRTELLRTARVVLGTAAVRHSPGRLAIAVASTDPAWDWVRHLPHGISLGPERPEPQTLAQTLLERAGGREVLLVCDGEVPVAPATGLHVLALASQPTHLPAETSTVVQVGVETGSQTGCLTDPVTGATQVFQADGVSQAWAEGIAAALHPLRDAAVQRAATAIPGRVGLFEALGLPKGAGVPTLTAAWQTSGRETGFPLGIGPAGPLWLDLVRDGPHALVGGTTGSGKSELLVSLVAGLAARNRPDELSFVLVDYKGGAAFGACRHLPHVVGVVTDLDHQLTERALVSLDAELKRREQLFAAAGVADLAAYQASWDSGQERIPRLIIVVDEFRSLAEELPGFVAGLVRVASVGRSLGVHLVVATQRPGGVVSADMRANIGLRIALRVRDVVDSFDVLDAPVAAEIAEHTPGRAFVQSAATPLTQVQTPLATAPALDGTGPAVQLLAVDGLPITAPARSGTLTELDLLVAATHAAATELSIPPARSPWLPPLPATLDLDDLPSVATGLAIGLLDDPARQRQAPWCWDPFAQGHLGICGGPRSGRSTALRTIAAQLARRHEPSQVHLYAVHTGSLADLEDLPHTAASVSVDDLPRLARMLGQLNHHVSEADSPAAPHVVVLLDNWERIADAIERARNLALLDQLLAIVRAGSGVRLSVAVTGSRAVLSGVVAGALSHKLLLLPADPIDVSLIGAPHQAVPSHPPIGRALDASTHTELHIARPPAPTQPAPGPPAPLPGGPRRIRPLPDRLSLADLESIGAACDSTSDSDPLVVIGSDGNDPVGFRLAAGQRRIAVLGARGSGRSTALTTLAGQLCRLGRVTVLVGSPPPHPTPAGPQVLAHDDVPELIALRTAHPDLAVLVDDAARATGTALEPVLREIARLLDETDGILVVSGQPSDVTTSFASLVSQIAASGTGLLLGALAAGEETALGLRQRIPLEDRPGRALLVHRGRATPVQVACTHPCPISRP